MCKIEWVISKSTGILTMHKFEKKEVMCKNSKSGNNILFTKGGTQDKGKCHGGKNCLLIP